MPLDSLPDSGRAPAPQQSVEEFIDSAPMGPRQRLIALLGLAVMVAEGLDITIASFVYPHVMHDWGTPMSAVTTVVTAGVLSMAIGGAVAGPLADRYGRKGVTTAGILVFGTATAAMALAPGIWIFALLRVVACVGLGAVAPGVMAIVADSTPAARRAPVVALAFSGIAAGTVAGGFLASAVIPGHGWPALLAVCGLAPLLLVPLVVACIPESVSVLIARGRPVEEIYASLALLVPGRDASDVGLTHAQRDEPEPTQKLSVIVLSRSYALTTLLIWLCYFALLGVVYLLLNYLPLMAAGAGLTASRTGAVVGLFGAGTLCGQLLASLGLSRYDRFRVLALATALSAVAVCVAAAADTGHSGMFVLVFVLGVCLGASMGSLQAVGALAYPATLRATGMGWMSGVGRVGTLASGLLGGIMISAGWGISGIFYVLCAPLALTGAAALLLRNEVRRPVRSLPRRTGRATEVKAD
ncbi:MFS transporter [Streptomyces sp. MA5143a]|uniref:MFS transporter n=1 Tax=Streptomyces sp. MA5143a TaxID=2083010 RepID=UPI000D2DF526|nr:MFS transporter [Streptomyces sp. MA5143a]SPE99914.1 4-hydroxybenzoate transporter PcaK [Streptomyces sp. MA5143a]